jgi:hypothetical protein
MKKRKTILNIVIVVATLSLIAAGSTLAYLTANAGTVVNKTSFVPPAGMTATLTEPQWDSEGKAEAAKAYPGLTVPKDPTVTNTSTAGISEWVGIQITFMDDLGNPLTTGADSQMSTLLSEITLAFNQGWIDSTGADPSAANLLNEDTNTYTFYYDTVLAPPVAPATTGDAATLFTSVTFANSGNSNDVLNAIRAFGGGGFQIYVQSGAAQGSTGNDNTISTFATVNDAMQYIDLAINQSSGS